MHLGDGSVFPAGVPISPDRERREQARRDAVSHASHVVFPAEAVQEGVTGHVVDPRSPSAVAAAVGGLLDDPARARAMGAAYLKTAGR